MDKNIVFKGLKAVASISLVGLMTFTLSGCGASNATIGTGAGAVAGGLIGSRFGSGNGQIVGTVVGAGAGALAGHAVGGYMDKTDELEAQQNANLNANTMDTNYYGNDVDYAYTP